MVAKRPKRSQQKSAAPHSDEPASGRQKVLGGSRWDQWNTTLLNQTLDSLWIQNSDSAEYDRQITATFAALVGISPKDELEGMMAAQLVAAHNAAMECYRRAMIGQQSFEGRRENLNQANKLSRTWAILLQALNHHRGKGQQKVTVEHVHVHAGGQAVVGMLETPGGGDRAKSEEQPHAKQIAHAPEPALRSPDSERERVPVPRHAERPLPDARRSLSRRPGR